MGKKAVFICLSGIDGAGKTVIAKKLAQDLRGEGLRCNYVWGNVRPFFLKPFILIAKLMFVRGKDKFKDYAGHSTAKRSAFKKYFGLSYLYHFLVWLDYLPQVFFKITVPLFFGTNVVCDRYVYDTLIDMAQNLGYSNERVLDMVRKYLKMFPAPDLVFFLDTPEETAIQRKDDIPSIEYLRERREMYVGIREACGMLVLDGSRDLAELNGTLKGEVLERLKDVA